VFIGVAMTEGRRLALFLDGTWNTVDDSTNVWRMKSLTGQSSGQLTYYSRGVGTQFGERVRGGMFGYGLDNAVLQAYQWLIEHYAEGDRLFIFGFSRGAYTARALAGFISKCGLLIPGAPLSIKQLYGRYRRGAGVRTVRELQNVPLSEWTLEERWMDRYALRIPIWLIGVWDTVGSLGIPYGNLPVISQSSHQFLETDLRINMTHAFHALAIDEHRAAFAPTLWTRTIPKNAKTSDVYPPRDVRHVEQRWFIGAHANVGGGCTNDVLAQLPLAWMMQKAADHGLIFQKQLMLDGNEWSGTVSDSYAEFLGGIYRIAKLGRRFHRSLGIGPREVGPGLVQTTINETIDSSVFRRWQADAVYRPQSLARWVDAYAFDTASEPRTVLAERPQEISPPIVG
jgi:uncharacterized protein (DUF2235 family)